MSPFEEYVRFESRRQFLGRGVNAVGWAAFASLLGQGRSAGAETGEGTSADLPGLAHFAPKARHVIYLHMVGGPSQLDLYDYTQITNLIKECVEKGILKQMPLMSSQQVHGGANNQ